MHTVNIQQTAFLPYLNKRYLVCIELVTCIHIFCVGIYWLTKYFTVLLEYDKVLDDSIVQCYFDFEYDLYLFMPSCLYVSISKHP